MTADIPGVWRGGKLPPEFDGRPDGIQPWQEQPDPWERQRQRQQKQGCRRFFSWMPFVGDGNKEQTPRQ